MTDAQRAQIRRYLGYSDKSRGFYSLLEGSITVLEPEAEEILLSILQELAEIEAALRDARLKRLKAKRVEDITLGHYDEIRGLRLEGQRLVMDISQMLGVPPLFHPFKSSPMTGTAARA